jgi:calcineurin-like phosphoesterase family protein
MSKVWFTADHHFGHENILKFSKRPFDNIDRHDAALVDAWNDTVAPGDVVFHLGDFAYRGKEAQGRAIFDALNGTKHLITGNHDRPWVRDLPWASVQDIADESIEGQRVFMCHYSLRTWPAIRHGTLMLYGHSHRSMPGNAQSLDVGVDCWGYKPVDLETIKARLAKSTPIVFRDDNDDVYAPEQQTGEIIYSFALTPFDGALHVFDHSDMPLADNLVQVRFRRVEGILVAQRDDIVDLRRLLGTPSIQTIVRHDTNTVAELEDLITHIQRRIEKIEEPKP